MQINNVTTKKLIEINFLLIFEHPKKLNFHYEKGSKVEAIHVSLIHPLI